MWPFLANAGKGHDPRFPVTIGGAEALARPVSYR